LEKADLEKADLEGANLTEAVLSRADLCDTNFHNAKITYRAQTIKIIFERVRDGEES